MRYKLVEEPGGTWAIFDNHTGKVADYLGVPANLLDRGFAEDVQAIVEADDLKHELTRKHTPF